MKQSIIFTLAFLYSVPLSARDVLQLYCNYQAVSDVEILEVDLSAKAVTELAFSQRGVHKGAKYTADIDDTMIIYDTGKYLYHLERSTGTAQKTNKETGASISGICVRFTLERTAP